MQSLPIEKAYDAIANGPLFPGSGSVASGGYCGSVVTEKFRSVADEYRFCTSTDLLRFGVQLVPVWKAIT